MGWKCVTVGAGVLKVNLASRASLAPPAARVPAGTVTVKSVAIGSRSTFAVSAAAFWTAAAFAAKRRVLVPIHCQVPANFGVMVAGTSAVASWPTVAIGTIGWSKVMLANGAIDTAPCGCIRNTCSGPVGEGSGLLLEPLVPGNGKGTDLPAGGFAMLCVGQWNGCGSALLPVQAGNRSTTAAICLPLSGLPSTTATGAAGRWPEPALSRRPAGCTRTAGPAFAGWLAVGAGVEELCCTDGDAERG